MLGWYCFSMEKLETWIYIQWFWLQIVTVSPGTHLVKNIESQSRNTKSQVKKKVCNWKCVGLCVTRQLIWLISLTDSKTLYYCSTLKSKYSPSKGQKKYASFNNSHNNCHRIHKRDISTNTHVQIFYGSLHPLECMPWILLFCIFGDFYASGMQDAEVNKVTAYFLYGQEIIRRFCFKM